MAKEIGHAPSTVHRIWRAFGLQPHRAETFKLSSDSLKAMLPQPSVVEKVRDIVGLYLSPPERALANITAAASIFSFGTPERRSAYSRSKSATAACSASTPLT